MRRGPGIAMLWLLTAALVLVSFGCRLFDPQQIPVVGSSANDSQAGGLLLAERTIDGAHGARIEIERSTVLIPAGARDRQTIVRWYRIPAASSTLVLPQGWTRRSDDFRLEAGDSEDPFQQPITVTLPTGLTASGGARSQKFGGLASAGGSRRFVGVFSPIAGWLLIGAADDAGLTRSVFETWRPGIWIAVEWTASGTPAPADPSLLWRPPSLIASPTILLAGSDGRWPSDLDLSCSIPLSGGVSGLIASGEWALYLRALGVTGLDLSSVEGGSGRRLYLDGRGAAPRLDLLSDPLVRREWGSSIGTATLRVGLKGMAVDQGPRRLFWESRLRLPNGTAFLGEGEISLFPKTLGLNLIAPIGTATADAVFRWRAAPDLASFRLIRFEVRKATESGEPLLAVDLAPPVEEYRPTAGEWLAFPPRVPLTWRVIGIDPDGRRIVSEATAFTVQDATGTGTGTGANTGTGTGTGTATDSPALATPPLVLSTIPINLATGVSPLESVTLAFDREMATASVEAGLRITPPGTGVRIGWPDLRTLVISPLSSFATSTTQVVELGAGIAAANGGKLVATFTLAFTTRVLDLVKPALQSLSPSVNATRVPTNTWVTLAFSEPMGRVSTQAAIRIVRPAIASLTFLWGDGDRRLEFLPAGNWLASTAHEILLASSASDLAGNKLGVDTRILFTTRAETGPVLRWSVPAADSTATQGVTELQFLFDQAMDRSSTEKAFRIVPVPSGSPVFGWASSDSLLSVRFSAPLADGASHTARIEASAMDAQKHSLAGEVVIPFRIADLTRPRVIGADPAAGTTVAINTGLRVAFSEPVDRGSVESGLELKPAGATGSFVWNTRGDEVTIVPLPSWPASVTLLLTIGSGVRDTAGNPLQTVYSASWPIAARSAPRVIRTIPVDGANGVSRTASLLVEFDASMASDSLPFGFSLVPSLAGGFLASWSADGRILEVIPLAILGNAVSYELTLGIGLQDRLGTPLAVPVPVRFTTADTLPPVVLRASPGDGAVGVDPWTTLDFLFDEPPRRSSAEGAFRLEPAVGGLSSFSWSDDGLLLTVKPGDRLATATRYAAGFAPGLADLSGNQLSGDVFIAFTTMVATAPPPPPPPAPRVDALGVLPVPGAIGVATQTQIRIPFTLPMDHGATEGAFSVRTGTGLIAGGIAWEGEVLVFSPSQALADGTLFTVSVTTAARERVNAQSLAATWISTFTTAVSPAAPFIQSTVPASGATGVDRNTLVQIGFSKPMASGTVQTSFSPAPDGILLASWSADFRLLTLFSTGGFQSGAAHQVDLAAGARSLDGILLTGATSFLFTTGIATPPRILGATPLDGAADVASTTVFILQFDRGMDQGAVQGALSFSPAVPGGAQLAWNPAGDVLEIRAASSWTPGVTWLIACATSAKDLAGIPISTPWQSRFSVLPPPPVLPPEVVATGVIPVPGAVAVGTGTSVEVLFSRPMDAGSTASAFALRSGVALVAGTSTWPEPARLRFQPAISLAYETLYRVEIATTALDQDGRALAAPWLSTFTVAAPVLPRLESTAPSDGADGVAVNSPISLTFTKPMGTSTVSLSWNPLPAGVLSPVWSNGDRTLSVTWNPGLSGATLYSVAVNASARDREGLALAGGSSLGFRTGTGEAPRILTTSPDEGAIDVSRGAPVVFGFDRAMDQGSLAGAVSIVPPATGGVSLTWSGDGKTATIQPSAGLSFGTGYQVRVGTGARDLLSTPLAQPFQLSFTTEIRPAVLASGTSPENDAANVATTAILTIAFNKPMNQVSVQAALSLTDGGNPVAKTVNWSGNTILVTPPAEGWPASRTLVLSLTTAATDPAGNTLAAPFSRSFSTRRSYGSVWREVLAHNPSGTQFPPRSGAAVIGFQGYLWVIGGFDGSEYRNDIWRSVDGITWQQVLGHDTTPPATQFAGRAFHACVVGGDGKLYLTGGENEDGSGVPQLLDDVWVTTTGSTWTRLSASAAFWARKGHMMIANAGKLYILAGQTEDENGIAVLLGDTWESSDGITWTEKSNAQTTGFFPRREGGAMAFGGKLWVWAGHGMNALNQEGPLNDAWYSTTGTVWVRAVENASYPARAAPAMALHAGRIWMAGGLGQSGGFEVFQNDVWSSTDGISWIRIRAEGPADAGLFSPRYRSGLAESGGKLYLIGGEDSWDNKNDVRMAE